MRGRSKGLAAASGSLAAIIVAASFFLTPHQARAWPAGETGDVAIDDFSTTDKDGGKIVIKHIEFTNTNLEKEEVQKLLTPATPKDEALELVKKLKADKISMPSIELSPKAGGLVRLTGFEASDIDEGRVGKLSIAGIDGGGEQNGAKLAIKSGALALEDADLAEVLKATGGAGGAPKGRLGHLTWQSVDIVAPDDTTPGKSIHVAFGSFELKSDYDGDVMKQGSTTLNGLLVEPAPGSEFATELASLGYSKIELGAAVGAHYEAGAKTLSLDQFMIEGVQMGSVGLKADFADIEPALFTGDDGARMQALLGGSIASLEIKLVNSGLFEKSLAFYAKQQGATPEALKQQIAATAAQMVPLMLGGAPDSLKVAAEAQKFINSPKNLTVSLKAKGAPLKAADFMAGDPSAILGKVSISAIANQ
ncbi:MAG TPA: hypothetical protein VKU03_06195 [Roseiarcus sp.]|nr:hypothetical protein [Roseiarcus sp.]